MARDIDVDNLDADQVAYLEQRPWLVAEAKQLGVEDIEERIAEVKAQEQAGLDKTIEGKKYDELKLNELRELAAQRRLDRSGSKAELVTRLEEDDKYQSQLKGKKADKNEVETVTTSETPQGTVSVNENPADSSIGADHPAPVV